MRIPFVMSCPAIFPGPQIVDDAVVSTVDIVPTLLDLMGIENKRSLDGISLLAERDPDRRVYMESFSPYLEFGWAPLFAYRTHQAKYIFAPKPEYYDLQTDPGELDNLFVPGEGPWQALDNEMSAFLKSQPSLDSVAAAATPPDEAAGKMLQDLGYLGSDQERLADAKGLLRNPLDMLSVREALDRARGLMASGKRDEALDLGEKALRDAPESRRLQNMMANIYLEMKHFDKAEAALRKSIELNDRADAYYNLSQLLLKQQRLDEAEDILTEAEAQHATHGSLWISKGDLAARRGRGLEAIEHYKQAKALDAYRTGALAEARIKLIEDRMVERGAMWLARGDEMADQGRYEEAIEFYGRAKILDPQHSGTKAQSRIETVQRLMHKPDVDGQQENGE
jgi:tetratricopeptide (TPR) repeat protein